MNQPHQQTSVRVYLGLGSNIEPHTHIYRVVQMLRDHFSRVQLSPVFRTAAEGFVGDDFLNLVACVETERTLPELITKLRELERRGGRRRETENGMGSRTLDIDLLLYGDLEGQHSGVRLPRAEIYSRRFVWQPLAEMMSDVTAQNPVEKNVRDRVLKLWNDRESAPKGFERVRIPNL